MNKKELIANYNLTEINNCSILDWKNKKKFQLSNGEIIGLNLYNCYVNEISFLKDFKTLEKINLRNNEIEDISNVLNDLKLTHLIIGVNPLLKFNIDGKNFPFLKVLDISSIASIKIDNIESMKNIEELYMSNNSLNEKSLEFEKFKSIKTLDISFNKISNLSFLEELINLETLILSNNNIKFIREIRPLLFLKNLKHLEINDNPFISEFNKQDLNIKGNENHISILKDLDKLITIENKQNVN
jgi:Leucine-rich repeat (LRR) protein